MGSDRNSYIGLFLIGIILFVWMYAGSPSAKEKAREAAKRDSVIREQKKADSLKMLAVNRSETKSPISADTSAKQSSNKDTAAEREKLATDYGIFYPALHAPATLTTLANDLITVSISGKGGKICSVVLNDFKTSAGTPLRLFYPDSTTFGLVLNGYSRFFSTDSLYFSVHSVYHSPSGDSSSIAMRLLTTDTNKYLEYVYTLKKGSYMVGCSIREVGMQNVLPSNAQDLTLDWCMKGPTQEAGLQAQQRTSTVYYKYSGDDVDYLSPLKYEKKSLPNNISWISFKQQFFSAVLIADTRFSSPEVGTVKESDPHFVKYYYAALSIPYNHQPSETFGMRFYFGPNNYHLLEKYSDGTDWQLERQINLGWAIFGWVNRFIVINIFHFLSQFNLNYGIVILILTLVIKAILFPIAFRTYVSSAKMRILKPEIDEINKKFPKTDEAMKKQQATMALYKKAGVNPLAGCIPMLFQLPILYALFSFFPASIELRQQKLFWANDLSTYDSFIHFSHFSLPFLGDHISLFAVLMTLSQYLYLMANQQMMNPGAADQMGKTMKWMTYIMPIFFLGVLNNYSAGLSYYYLLANLITFGQTYLARLFINEKELHRKMQEKKAKVVKPSKFQQRLEQMMKEQKAKNR